MEYIPDSFNRPLAYVAEISSLTPIQGADQIELATVRGWKVIVAKGQYLPHDLTIFCEIDSILPPWQVFIDLNMHKFGFKIKTIKMKGKISQGYCIQLKALEQLPHKNIQIVYENDEYILRNNSDNVDIKLIPGLDLTQLLKVKKYQVPDIGVSIRGREKEKMEQKFPHFIKRTDQSRIQNNPEYIYLYSNIPFEVTEKLEGSSVTAYYK